MYITTGTPRVLSTRTSSELGGGFELPNEAINSNQDQNSILMIRKAPFRDVFCSITTSTLSLWSIHPEIILSTVEREKSTIEQDGENVDVIWKGDGTQLVVLTNLGFLHYYDVVYPASTMLEFQFSGSYTQLPEKIPSMYLRFNMSLEIDSGVQCGIGLKTELLLCTNHPPSLLSLTWTGDANVRGTRAMADLDFYLDPKEPIAQLVSNQDQSLFGIVSIDGNVYLCDRRYDPDSGRVVYRGVCVYKAGASKPPATCMSFNPRFRYISIGNLHGVVHVYEIIGINPIKVVGSHDLALTRPGDKYTAVKLSAVTSLYWSLDGYVVAVAWLYGGFSVWSLFGCLLTSTISEDTFVHASDGIVRETDEIFFTGVQELFWSEHSLFVLPASTFDKEVVLDLYVVEFAKSALLGSLSDLQNRHVSFIASDRLLLYDGIVMEGTSIGMDPLNWTTIHIPSMYLVSNWPIRFVATSNNGQFIAIAGKRGFAHYNCASEKWKLFGNEHQEQGFQVTSLLWYSQWLIVGCKNIRNGGHEIRIFSRDSKLDDSQIVFTEKLQHEIISMNITGNNLLVYSTSLVIHSYMILVTDQIKVSLQLKQAFSLEGFIGKESIGVQAISRYFAGGDANEPLTNKPILLLKNGSLHMIWKKESGWIATKIADRVEHFWVSQERNINSELEASIWVFDGNGAKVISHPLAMVESPAMPKQKDPVFVMELDFYPLMVLLRQGVVVGIKQQVSLNQNMSISQFAIDIKAKLFVHLIIKQYLQRGLQAQALKFSSTYQYLGYFNHALEMMLHVALEEDGLQSKSSKECLLANIVQFVFQFPRSLEIIVNCTRKSEMALWGRFFSIAGDPKELYQRSVDSGAYHVATSYLIIIQTLEPLQVSSKLAIDLLERTMTAEDFETGSELYRFLKSIHHAEADPSNIIEPPEEQEKTNILIFEAMIYKKAKSFLLSCRFRDFLRFANTFYISKARFLKKERQVTEMLITSWEDALKLLHDQFNWPMPTKMPSEQLKRRPSNNTLSPLDDYNQPPPWYNGRKSSVVGPTKVVSRRENELRTLLRACQEGEFPELAALLATLLLDIKAIETVMQETPTLFTPWQDALLSTKNAMYLHLVTKTKEILKPQVS